MSLEFGRQAELDRVAVAQTGGDQDAFGEEPGSIVEDGARTVGAWIQLGGVDHQHRGAVAAQELTPGELDRLAGGPAVGEARFLQDLQPLEGRQRLRPVEAGHGALERLRRRHGTRQGGAVEPARSVREVAHGAFPPVGRGSASTWRAYRSRRGSASSVASPKERQPVTHFVTQAGCSPASTRSMQ